MKKIAPDLIETTSNKMDNVAKSRTAQPISQGAKEVEPRIIRNAMEEVYRTALCLLGIFGKQKYSQGVGKIQRIVGKLKQHRWNPKNEIS